MPTTAKSPGRLKQQGKILVVGASARQSVESAAAGGWPCVAADLFGDWDLQRQAECVVLESLDDVDKKCLLDSFSSPPRSFLIAGGMENRTATILQLKDKLTWLGVDPVQIDRLSDPFELASFCEEAGILFPETHMTGIASSGISKWLRKPAHSAGGIGISLVEGEPDTRSNDQHYLQQYIRGETCSSLFVAGGGKSVLIGSTRQLIGMHPFCPHPFSWCGSIGPIQLAPCVTAELESMGRQLTDEFEMHGVFGIDWIRGCDNRVWLIEINPRITASAELFERSGVCTSVVDEHVRACVAGSIGVHRPTATDVHGKAVVFNTLDRKLHVDSAVSHNLQRIYGSTKPPSIADLPRAGTIIEPGNPILTVFTTGSDEKVVRARLRAAADRMLNLAASGIGPKQNGI